MCIDVSLNKGCKLCADLVKNIKSRFGKRDFLFLGEYKSIDFILEYVFSFIEEYIKKLPDNKKKRKNGEPYIKHLIETANILLYISDDYDLSIDEIIIALLHDFIEDIDEVTYELLIRKFGFNIACGVRNLSKPALSDNLSIEEELLEKSIIDENYHEGLEHLGFFDLLVKFSDRIHNMKTLYGLDKDFIIKYIAKTYKYFLKLAKKVSNKAHELLVEEMSKLIKYLCKEDVDLVLSL